MKKTAKKLLSVFLAALLALTVFAPASAASSDWRKIGGSIPVVHIFGDGAALYKEDGEKLIQYRDLLSKFGKDDDDSDMTEEEKAAAEARKKEILRSVANVVLPFLIQGIGTGDYTAYYENLEKEIGDIFKELLLDENGNVTNGSGISQEMKDTMESRVNRGPQSSYGLHYFQLFYDWRLDPLETADQLHEYIEKIKKSTGAKEVSLAGRCLGASVLTAALSTAPRYSARPSAASSSLTEMRSTVSSSTVTRSECSTSMSLSPKLLICFQKPAFSWAFRP